MNQKNILILDYSVDRSGTPAIKRWLPPGELVTSLFIDTAESFPDDLVERSFTHVIHSGSALSITEPAPFTEKAAAFIRHCRDKGIAQFGICYGHQFVCKVLVGEQAVRSSPNRLEAGWGTVTFNEQGMNLLGLRKSEVVWQHHFDEVIKLPEGSHILATNPHSEIQAYVNFEQRLLGTQFHPEFDREAGNQLYFEDRELLEKNGYSVDEIVKGKPSFDTGKVFFGFFLEKIA
jgi:GMP synthase-like glutamine amidotransferase